MAQYDPNKKYTWTPEDTFELTGRDFGLILNMLRSMLNTEEAAKILLAQQANSAIEAVLARGVEAGHVKEVVEEVSSKDL
jgi:hypothetical protein